MTILEPILLREYDCKLSSEIPYIDRLESLNFITPKDETSTDKSKKFLGLHKVHEPEKGAQLKAHWFVGVRWLLPGECYVNVEPKINLNYLEMYLSCLNCKITSRHLDRTFDFYPDEELIPLEDKKKDISPLIIASFLKTVYDLVKKKIKHGFLRETENLNGKIKGRILINGTIAKNFARLKPHITYCNYQIFSIDCIENQILKLSLEQVSRYLSALDIYANSTLNHWLSYSRKAFEKVSLVTITERDFRQIHYSTFYKEYRSAHRLAKLILKRFGFDIHQSVERSLKQTPPFWIDMNELFERYCEVLLRKNGNYSVWAGYKKENIGANIRVRPDFLIKNKKYILDSKYKPDWDYRNYKEDVYQVIAYSRHQKVLRELGFDKNDLDNAKPDKIFILYPPSNQAPKRDKQPIKEIDLESNSNLVSDEFQVPVYRVAVQLPLNI